MPDSLSPGRSSLNEHLFAHAKAPDDLRHLILHIATAAKYIHHAIRTTEAGLAGTENQFGEKQVKLDVLSEDIIRQNLAESRLVATHFSEESDDVIELNADAPYSVVYDPLDGSSLVDVNFAIGSIFGIYPGSDIIGRTPRDQVAALYVLYGPRTLLVYAAGNGVHEFILNEVGEFILLREFLGVGDTAKTFSPGNLAAVQDHPALKTLVQEWSKTMTLRYAGCMVADAHHVLSKGQGVFFNVGGGKFPDGKLRMIFECGPFAYLIDQAGGIVSDGTQSLLDTKITSLDQRTPIVMGSKGAVEKVCEALKA